MAAMLLLSACGEQEPEDIAAMSDEIRIGTTINAPQNPKVVALYHMSMCDAGNPYCPVKGQLYWFPRPCSASVLRSKPAETWILTARHCVTPDASFGGVPVAPSQLAVNTSVSPGLALPNPPVGSFIPDAIVPADLAPEDTGYDLALVRVAAELPVSGIRVSLPIWQGAVNMPQGALLTAFGYGRRIDTAPDELEDGTTGAGTLRRALNLPLLSVCPGCGRYGQYTYTDQNALGQAVVHGDSGGPTFLQSSLSTPFMQVVGVHSTACYSCSPSTGNDALTFRAATDLIKTYLGYLFVSSFAQPDRNLNVIGAIASGSSAGTTTTKDTAATHWMYDPATAMIYTTVGATRYYLTARKPAESVGTDRGVYITSSSVGGGYQQWSITPDYVNNRGLGSTGNAEILAEISPGVVTVGPYFNYPAGSKWAWHTHP